MTHPRVLYVGNFFSSATKALQVCEELARRLPVGGASVITTSNKTNRILRLLDMVTTVWIRRTDYDVAIVDVFSGPSFLWAWGVGWLLRVLGKPFIFTLHGGGLPDYSESRDRRIRKVLGWATVVVAPSQYLAERMAPYRTGIMVIPNGIDIGAYPFRVRRAAKPRIVWLRAFHRIYDPTMAPRVLALVKKRFPAAHLTMVGPDKDGSLEETRRTAVHLGVADAVDFVGAVPKDEVPGILEKGDIFLNTTTIDNTPVSVIEAMACGLCVVSTDAGGIPYLIEDGKEGLLARIGDGEAMAGHVCEIIEDQDLAAGISENGRRRAEGFDWSVVVPRWVGLIRETGRLSLAASSWTDRSKSGSGA